MCIGISIGVAMILQKHAKKHEQIDRRLEVLNEELEGMEEEIELQAAVVQNLGEGIMLVETKNGLIAYANPQLGEMFGYEATELKGKHISLLALEKEAEEVMEALKAKRTHQILRTDVTCTKKDGTAFVCEVSISTFNHKSYGEVWVGLHKVKT